MRNSKLMVLMSKALPLGALVGLSLGSSVTMAADGLLHGSWNSITPSDTTGIIYASEIFGPSGGEELPLIDTAGSPAQPTVVYTDGLAGLANTFPIKFRVIYELDNAATFQKMDAIDVATAPTKPFVISGFATVLTDGNPGDDTFSVVGPSATGDTTRGGSGKSFAKFDVSAVAVNGADAGIKFNTLALAYQIQAKALASPGQKVTLTMKITDIGELETYAMVERSIVLASSAQGTTLSIEPFTDAYNYRLAVGTGNLEFSGTDLVDEAAIGYLTVKDANFGVTEAAKKIYCPNGTEAWQIGEAVCALVGTGNSGEGAIPLLSITGGQFAASIADPGGVRIGDNSTQVAYDGETLSLELDDSTLAGITGSSSAVVDTGLPADSAFITIVADGVTAINNVENAPVAELVLSYKDDTFQKTSVAAVELVRIRPDGTTCTVYNVPPSNGSDDLSIRITNMSAVDGEVYGALYDKDANEIFPSTLLTNKDGVSIIKPKATLALFGPEIEKIAGTWSGRAILVLTTTLPNIDVLGLLRDKSSAAAPLTNLSTGVTGKSCVK